MATVEIPLESLHAGTSAVPISFGPLVLPGAGGAIRLHFHPAALLSGDGGRDEVFRSGDMVILPLTFGHDRTLPDRIDLKCLNEKLTSIRYRHEGNSQTFRVVSDRGECGGVVISDAGTTVSAGRELVLHLPSESLEE